MSTITINECWPLAGMTITQKAVLIALAHFADGWSRQCCPTISMIARHVCGSERAVQSAIKWLEGHGAIQTNRLPGEVVTYTVTPTRYRAEAAS